MPLYRVAPFVLLPLLVACASRPAAPVAAAATPAAAIAQPAPEAAEPPLRPFPAKTLESLLVAEFAAQRQHADITLENYLAEARKTRDPAVVARATTVAQVLNQPQALEMAKLWTEVSPQAADAWYLLSLNALRQLRFDIATDALDHLLQLQPEADLEQLFMAAVPATQTARDELFNQLGQLAKTRPDNAHLLFGQALLKAQSGKPAEALEIAEEAHKLRPQSSQITLLNAKLLTEVGRSKDAASLLASALKKQPDSYSLRLNYGRALIRSGNLDGAEREFQSLVERLPQDDSLRLSLALIAYDNRHDDVARRELETLASSETHADEANYYLGLLNLRQNNKDAAISSFESVQPGNQYLPAQAEIVRILVSQNQAPEARARLAQARTLTPELAVPLYQLEAELLSESGQAQEAWDLLDTALKDQPENTLLLLSRAMAAEKLNRLDDFEADMREVLRYEPDNPSALNALGYTLADRTSRLDEAEAYIRRAHELKPDDPAIIDSMGWVKFKRGDANGALDDLRRAYALYPDDEIAAHLGEVLWASGKKDEARRIWTEALRQHPKSTHIPETRQRLDPS
ncbi:MAG: tetratricopeptide repeat protein [Pedobacter sp.]|nr:tetratricopeptide repeat protein [Pedobacter sp.]